MWEWTISTGGLVRTGDTSTGSVGGKVMGAMSYIKYVQNTKKVVPIIDFNKCTSCIHDRSALCFMFC